MEHSLVRIPPDFSHLPAVFWVMISLCVGDIAEKYRPVSPEHGACVARDVCVHVCAVLTRECPEEMTLELVSGRPNRN